jgi:adenosylcobinamide kinase/adenosylcobinamide-phosphate guanylyltransferase
MNKKFDLPSISLVLGGARSGKSHYAETLIEDFESPIYLATAEAHHADDLYGEMTQRIAKHKEIRGDQWQTVEEPIDLVGKLNDYATSPVIVDCMTLWLANILSVGKSFDEEIEALTECLNTLTGPLVLVSNEVGQGIVPVNSLARSYMDNAGRMNQRLAACAGQVVFMYAGIPQILKDE